MAVQTLLDHSWQLDCLSCTLLGTSSLERYARWGPSVRLELVGVSVRCTQLNQTLDLSVLLAEDPSLQASIQARLPPPCALPHVHTHVRGRDDDCWPSCADAAAPAQPDRQAHIEGHPDTFRGNACPMRRAASARRHLQPACDAHACCAATLLQHCGALPRSQQAGTAGKRVTWADLGRRSHAGSLAPGMQPACRAARGAHLISQPAQGSTQTHPVRQPLLVACQARRGVPHKTSRPSRPATAPCRPVQQPGTCVTGRAVQVNTSTDLVELLQQDLPGEQNYAVLDLNINVDFISDDLDLAAFAYNITDGRQGSMSWP